MMTLILDVILHLIDQGFLSPFQGWKRLGGISLPQVPQNLRFFVNWGY